VTDPPCGSSRVTVSLIIASVYTRLNVEIPLETGCFSTFSAVCMVWATHIVPKEVEFAQNGQIPLFNVLVIRRLCIN